MSWGPSGDSAADFRGKRLAVSIVTHNRVHPMSERGSSTDLGPPVQHVRSTLRSGHGRATFPPPCVAPLGHGRVMRNHIVLDVFGSQVSLQCGSYGHDGPPLRLTSLVSLTLTAPRDIDTAMADSLKALDPKRPMREADVVLRDGDGTTDRSRGA
jgi:hypothetical protein